MVEETCYNPDRCKWWTGSSIGVSIELSSDDSKVGTPWLDDEVILENESLAALSVMLADGDEQVRGEDARQQTSGQNSCHGPLGNNLRLLTRSQNLVALEGTSGPTVADKSKIGEVTRGQSEADGAEAGVNRSFTQQRRFGEKYTEGVTITTISKEKEDKNGKNWKQSDAVNGVKNNNESG
ncbi:hypothetical protein GYH30_027553 [Glycine max]|nr:hypothetical protein GYH30_027553 [Glycine max]